MVTEKMIEAAARADAAHAGRTFEALSGADKTRFVERAKLMLCAALSTDADPVGYIHDFRATLQSNWARDFSFSPLVENDYIRNIKPLYAAPPAPSVAVKALDEITPYLLLYNLIMEAVIEGIAKATDPQWTAKDFTKSEYYNLILAALSAQEQDVAGWQDISTAPKDGTWVLLGGGEYSDDTGDASDVAVARWHELEGGGWLVCALENGYATAHYHAPTHWMPTPAAPAAKLEEKPSWRDPKIFDDAEGRN